MRKSTIILVVFLSMFSIIPLVFNIGLDPVRTLAFILMGSALSITSIVIYYKKLEFLAAEAPHISLSAVTIGYILEYYLGLNALLSAIAIGIMLIHVPHVLSKYGFSQDKSTAVVVSLASALSIIAIHYALTNIPVRYSLSSLILGDPLLLTYNEAILAILISLIVVFMAVISLREIIEISIDEVSASLMGINVKLYEVLAYSIVGLASIGLLRLAGYVMEHVLLLLPAIVSSIYSNNLKEHLVFSFVIGTSLASIGYILSFALNTVPTGIIGILLILLLLIKYVWGY